MRLLILTQKIDINDDVLGFMHGWINEFAKHCQKITVIALSAGEYDLPGNVKVLSLGKEKGRSRVKYLINFYKYIWRERKNYDAVFVHMNHEYVFLGGLVWRLWHKKIGLWYAHRHAPFSLRIAERLTQIIFTSTQSGFRLKSKKINVIGQGIDINKFTPLSGKLKFYQGEFKIISVGRISPSKDYDTLIKAAELLKNKGVKIKVQIIGGPATEADKSYFKGLRQAAAEKKIEGEIEFIGPVANKEIVGFLQSADMFVNMGQTGSLDKAIVEAMACGLPVLTCNEALLEVLGEYKDVLMYGKGDYKMLAEKIGWLNNLPEEKIGKIGYDLRQIVVRDHSLEKLISKMINLYEKNTFFNK